MATYHCLNPLIQVIPDIECKCQIQVRIAKSGIKGGRQVTIEYTKKEKRGIVQVNSLGPKNKIFLCTMCLNCFSEVM